MDEDFTKLNLKQAQFLVNNIGCGPILLKAIIQAAHVDTHAMVIYLHEQLTDLQTYIKAIKYDIDKFNDHTMTLITCLSAHQEMHYTSWPTFLRHT